MTYRVVISERALCDLRDIRDYISNRSPENALRFIDRLIGKFDLLEASPESFAMAPENQGAPFKLHQLTIRPYRVLYRIVDLKVEILHIRHGARLSANPNDLS